jgi:2'-5' RNA ligase
VAAERTRRLGADPLGEAGVAVRAFFGLPMPEEHKAALGPYIAGCTALAQEFRWTPAENLHLTIQFLGQVKTEAAFQVADRLAGAGLRGFELELGELGTFRRGKLDRVVWVGLVAGGAETAALAAKVKAECAGAGLEGEARAYHAHLTLARARPREGAVLPSLPAPPRLPRWRAGTLILYRSLLGRKGSVYEPLRTISFS